MKGKKFLITIAENSPALTKIEALLGQWRTTLEIWGVKITEVK